MLRSRLLSLFLAIALVSGACADAGVLAPPAAPGAADSSTEEEQAPPTPVAELTCPPAPDPAPNPGEIDIPADPAAIEPILAAVASLRCLEGANVVPTFITREEAPAVLQSTETPEDLEEMARLEPIARLLGWIEPGVSLYDAAKELTTGLVLGFYVPTTDKLYVVTEDGAVTPLAQRTTAHEWVHALQDAKYDLEAVRDAIPDDDLDASGALTAVVEGDAVHYENKFADEYFSEKKRKAAVEEELDLGTEAMDSIELGPLLWDLLMPYQYGPAFVRELLPGGTPPLQDVYQRLPRTSAEILHPELWEEGFTPEPTDLPDFASTLGPAWARTFDGTWGEYSTANTLAGFAGTIAERELTTVEGWRGDRLQLWTSGASAMLALATTWDSESTAGDFVEGMRAALGEDGESEPNGFYAFDDGRHCRVTGGGRITVLLCSNDAATATALGAS